MSFSKAHARGEQVVDSFRARMREHWQEFRTAEPGHRFQERFDRRARERANGGSQLSRILIIGFALVCLAIAIPLMILPGPAILFYLLSGFLLAGESGWIASGMDRLEKLLRRIFKRPGRRRLKS
ncbi:hypothetical protein [Synoicihabitans lomoniglobus]|uniref:TIGR02611 family protein n=1 Tax=Synoicihabitans lomoniglobus TaxID=2909285 RepID=A0AAE9ZRW8_9BACT|nr:hypothetical protein [Opitutaceae bacterium LMO-M01]WED63072.1 hypothetical protein PXH66_12090 [Opitutaceae bacterium LMO-M01]